MKRWTTAVALVAWLAVPAWGVAAGSQARLLLAPESVPAGATVLAGVHLRLPEGWHTYWRNPGDSGLPVTIEWSLPVGVTAGELTWPVPDKLTDSGLTGYVYSNDVVLLAPIQLAPTLPPGPLALTAKVSWLECAQLCRSVAAPIQATLQIGGAERRSADAALLETWQQRLPAKAPLGIAKASWKDAGTNDTRTLIIEWTTTAPPDTTDFFPFVSDRCEVQGATEKSQAADGRVRLEKSARKLQGEWPEAIEGLLVAVAAPPQPPAGFTVKLDLTAVASKRIAAATTRMTPIDSAPAMPAAARPSVWRMLLYAFIGGLILNLMPCVLPVIALKILGFVGQSREHPARVRKLGLLYAAGVLVSFAGLAGIVIGAHLAGRQAGWGFQLGNPPFVVLLTTLVTLVALNLFGVFEVMLGARVMGAASGWASREGAAGAFFNGVLATILATPCTAPFLGAALGFAFLQPPVVMVAMFLTVGLGLALPYVVLSWQPAWLQLLPRPGAWMERFKIAMGFPMLATAVWLFHLAAGFYGRHILWLGLFLVGVAMAAWIYGEFYQRGINRRSLALIMVLALLGADYGWILEGQLHWRAPLDPVATAGSLKESPEGIDWQPWTPEAVDRAQAEGRPVFVDFTADWCMTCQVNKKTSLEIASVRARLKAMNAVALLGDYTRLPERMTAELNRFQRAGVPLVLVYPKGSNRPPLVLPEVLTPAIVLEALAQAER